MPKIFMKLSTAFLLLLSFASNPALSEEVAKGDTLEISILEWDRASGSVRLWENLSSDYPVSDEGKINFPFLGDVVAVGIDTNNLAVDISNLLLERLNLADVPAVRVSISDRSPVLVYGIVRNAGRIEFRKGQTVRKVFVAAGATPFSLSENLGLELEEVSASLDNLNQRHALLSTRLERLQAEGMGRAELALPPSIDKNFESIQDIEQSIFGLNREQSARRQKLLTDQIQLLKNEIESLDVQAISTEKQLELTKAQLDVVDDLAARGLTVNSRRLDALSLVSNLEARMLTLRLAKTEAQQNLALAEIDLVDAKSGASVVQLVNAQDVKNQILMLEAQRITLSTRAKLLAATLEPSSVLEARLWRSGMDVPVVVDFEAPVLPGDVIEFRSK
ncbi:hypothetical protein HJ526_17360 [Donghicola sp. C2-DW-16]|uniref:Uncharacterized protein n=1 Tax=Donghicola mangrovi TaxID=2729614 RepID=A0ABX2PIG8_9RHOB|nr:polysaccharide biosynthesis/export family protein [Donghicola mangrovi]NVO29193.1 hypothetical protein [Donghicola mangrovi]